MTRFQFNFFLPAGGERQFHVDVPETLVPAVGDFVDPGTPDGPGDDGLLLLVVGAVTVCPTRKPHEPRVRVMCELQNADRGAATEELAAELLAAGWVANTKP